MLSRARHDDGGRKVVVRAPIDIINSNEQAQRTRDEKAKANR
jgi:hypothetical protein